MEKVLKYRVFDKKLNEYYKPIYEAYKGNLYDLSLSESGEISVRTMQGNYHESIPKYKDRYIIELTITFQNKRHSTI